MKKIQFAVTSKYFSVYEAFKKEAENLGWKYVDEFTKFTPHNMKTETCLYCCNNFIERIPLGFAFSNHDGVVLDLDSMFGYSVERLKEITNQSFLKKTCLRDGQSVEINFLKHTLIVNDVIYAFDNIRELYNLISKK